MGGLRLVTFAVSLVAHAALAAAFLAHESGSEQAAFDQGVGADLLKIEQGLAIEGSARGVDAENVIIKGAAEEIAAQTATDTVEEKKPLEPEEPPTEQKEVKEVPELNDVITAKAEPVPESVVTEKLDPETVKEVKPEQQVTQTTPPQIQAQELVASGRKQEGGDTTQRTAYLGKLQKHINEHKIVPATRRMGTVIVRFTVSPDGKLLSREITKSSGSEQLDKAALAALESAEPFPPFPEGVTGDELALSLPFNFITR